MRYTMKFALQIVFLGIMACAAAGMVAAQDKLYPVDEATKDPSLKDFRDKLLEAVKKRDKEFLLSVLDPTITNSFGGSGGIEEFRQKWNPGDRNSRLWPELAAILMMGGSFVHSALGTQFCAPYVYSESVGKGIDPYEYAPITEKNTPVHAKPDDDAPIVITLSYDIVKVIQWPRRRQRHQNDADMWVKIITPDGRLGYVSAKSIRSSISYCACFANRKGKWVMTALVAGD